MQQTEDSPPPPPVHAADPSKADYVPTGTNPFLRLRGHNVMAALNANLVPWLIAEYGIDYSSWDHVDVATEMITHIVTKLQLGQYTSRTFAAVVEGHRVEQTAFTKFVLRQAGNFIFFLFCSIEHNSSHPLGRQGRHCPSQLSSPLADKVLVQSP